MVMVTVMVVVLMVFFGTMFVVVEALPLSHVRPIYDERRPFLEPRVKALLLMMSILLGLDGDVGLVDSLPDRAV